MAGKIRGIYASVVPLVINYELIKASDFISTLDNHSHTSSTNFFCNVNSLVSESRLQLPFVLFFIRFEIECRE